jgi:hypothetical protein
MTIKELHIAFTERLDKAGSDSYAELSIYQRDFYLNQAVETFVKQRYGGNNYRREAYEETQKRTDDIRGLVKFLNTNVFTTESLYRQGVHSVTLPTDYMFYLNATVYIRVNNCDEVQGYLQRIQIDEIDRVYIDPYNRPRKNFVLEWMLDNKIYLGTGDNVSLVRYIMEYIKLPTLLVYDPSVITPTTDGRYSELTWDNTEYFLPKHTHSEIVEIAVRKAIETLESPRIMSQNSILSEIE